MREHDALGVGQIIGGRFALERKLGVGGFASVWLATDAQADASPVALKILHPRHRDHAPSVERFMREARLLGQLRHPNIAGARGFVLDAQQAVIVLEYAAGRSLRWVLDVKGHRGELPAADEVVALVVPMLDALRAAHAASVIHRDLKPSNVIVVPGTPPVPKLVDFGIAKDLRSTDGELTTHGHLLGSITYLTPEQIQSGPIDARTDVFAAGTLLFEIATLRRMWALDEAQRPMMAASAPLVLEGLNAPCAIARRILAGPRPRISVFRPELPRGLDAIVERACAPSPSDRFEDAAAMAHALRQALSGVGAPELRPREDDGAATVATRIADDRDLTATEPWAPRSAAFAAPTCASVSRGGPLVVNPSAPRTRAATVLPPLPVASARTRTAAPRAATTVLRFPPADALALRADLAKSLSPALAMGAPVGRTIALSGVLAAPAEPRASPPPPAAGASAALVWLGVLAIADLAAWSLADRGAWLFAPLLLALAVGLLARGVVEHRAHRRVRALIEALLTDTAPHFRWSSVQRRNGGYQLRSRDDALTIEIGCPTSWRRATGPLEARLSWPLGRASALRTSARATLVFADAIARCATRLPGPAADLLRASAQTLVECSVQSASVEGAELVIVVVWPGDEIGTLVRVAQAAVRVFRAVS